ncbi:MAG: helix-turn-helix domain-containing protein [Methanoculleus sp.]|jgi:transposase
MLRAYKYRMYPSQEQVASLMHHIHACRFVYNNSLEQKIRAYEQDGKKLSCFDLNNRLPALKEEHNGSALTAVLTTTAISTRQSTSRNSPCKIKILSGYQAQSAPKGLWTCSRWGGE